MVADESLDNDQALDQFPGGLHFVAEEIHLRDNQWEDDPTVMTFGARYEILRALTRGDVETFAVRDRTTGEKALAHIFECPEPPPDQPTIQWILVSFSRLVSEAPGIVTGAGRYDVAGFAYVVSRWTTDEDVEQWVQHDKDRTSSAEPRVAADPSDRSSEQQPQAAPPSFTPEALQAIGDSSLEKSKIQTSARQPGEFTQQFFGGMEFPGDRVAAESQASAGEQESHSGDRPVAASEAESGARLGEPMGGEPSSMLLHGEPQEPVLRNPGDFTAQFFREINPPLEQPAQTSGVVSAEGAAKPELRKEASIANEPAVGAGHESWVRDARPGQFTDQFMRDFGPEIRAEPHTIPSEQPPKAETGEFTKLFCAPVAAEDSQSVTLEGRISESKSGTGEFTRIFGPYRSGTSGEAGFPSEGGEEDAASIAPAGTELFAGKRAGDHPSIEESNGAGPRLPAGQVQADGATHAFAARREFQERPEAVPTHEPLTKPVVSQERVLDSNHFNAVDGGATVLFRAPAEVPTPGEPEQPAGPSDYTMFMNREALSALVSEAGGAAPASGASQGGAPAAVPSPVFTPPVVTPPAMPSYQAPVVPGVAPPAMPSVAPPAVAAPSAPSGQATGKPKSYWPLIIILNVLLILAVLLILYFALRH